MTTKSDFTEEEWARVRRAPFVAGMAISIADPGGPIEMAKESMGTVKSATNPPSREQLLTDIALDLQSMTQQRQNPLSDFKPRAPDQIQEELRAVSDLVSSKASPRRQVHSSNGCLRLRRPLRMPPRKAVSWASARSRSAKASRRCWTSCA